MCLATRYHIVSIAIVIITAAATRSSSIPISNCCTELNRGQAEVNQQLVVFVCCKRGGREYNFIGNSLGNL